MNLLTPTARRLDTMVAQARGWYSGMDPTRRWMLGALLLLVVGVTGSLVAAHELAAGDARQSRAALTLASDEVDANLSVEIAHVGDLLSDEAAYMHENFLSAPGNFWQWAGDARVRERYPALIGTGEILLIPRRQLAAWLERLRVNPPDQGDPNQSSTVVPGGVRPYYCLTVASIAPTVLDTAVAQPNLDACAVAPNLFATRASGGRAGYVFALPDGLRVYGEAVPVYGTGSIPSTAAGRRRAFVGWAGVAIDAELLLREALIGNPQLRLVLRSGQGGSLAFSAGPRQPLDRTVVLRLADGSTALVSGPVKRGSILANGNAAVIAGAGLVTSLLVAALVFLLGTGRGRARRMVVEKTGELEFLALHDALTELPNRVLVFDRVGHALSLAERMDRPVAALFIDLDGFKNVNDTFGHAAGDHLLKVVAARLCGLIRGADTVGRLGGDEFVILIEPQENPPKASLVAERILQVMAQPIALESGREVTVSVSIGIAVGQRCSADDLLRDADVALYAAKRRGRNQYVVFEDDMQTAIADRLALAIDLKHARANGELFLAYQPTFELQTGKVDGVEALLRWRHPVRGLVPPAVFIPIAEETGEIIAIGRWVAQQACAQAARWQRSGHSVRTSVNVSALQLDSAGFVTDVMTTLVGTGLNPRLLTLEVTETALMRDPAAGSARLRELKALGVRIAIDDFGTGYSSLAYLRELPVDALKIDRAFVTAIASSVEAAALMRTLVQLGKTLGLETVGEGIEDEDQLKLLRDAGCDLGQGFLLGTPDGVERVQELLRAQEGRSSPTGLPHLREVWLGDPAQA